MEILLHCHVAYLVQIMRLCVGLIISWHYLRLNVKGWNL